MSRRVPEAAPLVGVVLAFAVAAFGALFAPPGSLLSVALLAALPLYGFTAFGVARSREPTRAIPPDPVLAVGLLAGAAVGGYGIATGADVAFAAFVALALAAPPAAYHARYGHPVNPLSPRATVAAAGALAVGLLGVGIAEGDPALGAVDAALVVLAAADYRDARGAPLDDLVEFTAVAVCFAGAALSVLYFTLVADAPATGLLAGAALLVVGAYFSL